MKKTYLFLGLFLLAYYPILAQDSKEEKDSLPEFEQMGLFPKTEPTKLYRFGMGGMYRFFGTYTDMQTPYLLNEIISDYSKDRNLFIGDDSQLPNLQLNFSGRPTVNTAWDFDLYAFQFLDGSVNQAYSGQVATTALPSITDPLEGTRMAGNMGLLLGMNLYGSHSTPFGSFNIGVGGLQWV
ncbi:MAG: hypothetical protein KDC92_02730, partial [Bacteroidetes bacterium]|nr:hypothetical protein [Bacteroidota bacterium]